MNIVTSRLILIPVSENHIKDIYINFNEKVISYMIPSVAKDIDETRQVVKKFIDQRKNNTDYVYAITLKNNGEFIGVVGLHDLKEGVAKLGIWTKITSHNNHYGREAVGGMIEYGSKVGLKRLLYPVDRRNIPSKKIPLFYGGKLVVDYKEVQTPDGRILEEEIYEIEIEEKRF